MTVDQAIGTEAYLRIIAMAAKIEPDHAKLHDWFYQDSIVEMGDETAKSLIDSGKVHLLEKFLMSILMGVRE